MTNWSSLTVAQLKQHLKDRGLNTTGKKADLVARLQESDDLQDGEDKISDPQAAHTEQEAAEEPVSPKAKGRSSVKGHRRKSTRVSKEEEKTDEATDAPAAGGLEVMTEQPVGDTAEGEATLTDNGDTDAPPDKQPAAADQQQVAADVAAAPDEDSVPVKQQEAQAGGTGTAEQEKEVEELDFEPEGADMASPPATAQRPQPAVDASKSAAQGAGAAAARKGNKAADVTGGEAVDMVEAEAQETVDAVSKEQESAKGAADTGKEIARKRKHQPIPAPTSAKAAKNDHKDTPKAADVAEDKAGTEAAAVTNNSTPLGDHKEERAEAAAGPAPAEVQQPERRMDRQISGAGQGQSPPPQPPQDAPPVQGEPSRALRIDKFVRPFTDTAVKRLLQSVAEFEDFWMPTIKTHCYVVFSTDEGAAAAAAATNHLLWPPENKSRLIPKFVPLEEAQEAMAVGRGLKPGPPPAEEASKAGKAKFPGAGPATKEAPAQEKARERANGAVKAPAPEPEMKSLDDLFRRTTAVPPIYWLPLTDEEVKQKQLRQQQRQELP